VPRRRTIGVYRNVTVRLPGGRLSVQRRAYWGPAHDIPVVPIIKYEYRASRTDIEFGFFPRHVELEARGVGLGTAQAVINTVLRWYDSCYEVVRDGCLYGHSDFIRKHAAYIPQRTGRMRDAFLQTFVDSIMEADDLPITVRVGVPGLRYAGIVNKYRPTLVQLKHQPGKQMSGVVNKYPYDAGLGDPKAQYGFFSLAAMHARADVKRGVEHARARAGIPKRAFRWLVRVTERRHRIV